MTDLGEFQGTGYPGRPGKCILVIGAYGIRLNSNLQIDGVSVKNIAAAVMNALSSQFTATGSFGQIITQLAADNAENKSTLTTVAAQTASLPGDVLDEAAAGHNTPGTVGEVLNTMNANGAEMILLRKLAKNDRIVDKDTGILTIFDDDGTTPLVQIQLKNGAGENSYKNVLEWREV